MSRKPRPIKTKHRHSGYPHVFAEVHEDHFAEQFAEPGDIQVHRNPKIDGDIYLFEDESYAAQAEKAEALGLWLLKYAKWIKTRKHSEDPNGE